MGFSIFSPPLRHQDESFERSCISTPSSCESPESKPSPSLTNNNTNQVLSQAKTRLLRTKTRHEEDSSSCERKKFEEFCKELVEAGVYPRKRRAAPDTEEEIKARRKFEKFCLKSLDRKIPEPLKNEPICTNPTAEETCQFQELGTQTSFATHIDYMAQAPTGFTIQTREATHAKPANRRRRLRSPSPTPIVCRLRQKPERYSPIAHRLRKRPKNQRYVCDDAVANTNAQTAKSALPTSSVVDPKAGKIVVRSRSKLEDDREAVADGKITTKKARRRKIRQQRIITYVDRNEMVTRINAPRWCTLRSHTIGGASKPKALRVASRKVNGLVNKCEKCKPRCLTRATFRDRSQHERKVIKPDKERKCMRNIAFSATKYLVRRQPKTDGSAIPASIFLVRETPDRRL